MVIRLKILNKTKILGITLFPFIFVRPSASDVTINHEKIHLQQQLELLVILFYIIYGLDYIIGRFKGLNDYDAYRNIRFEKEAFKHQGNFQYLKERKRYVYKK